MINAASSSARGSARRSWPAQPVANLIVPGAGKSGTSSLHAYLDHHPDIYMSRLKEPHFFSNPDRHAEGLDAYAELFRGSGGTSVRGESSTTYMQFPGVIERIEACLPDVRFIFILRNPIDRIGSHHRWLAGLGLEDRPLREAVLADVGCSPTFADRVGGSKFRFYADESRYARHLAKFMSAFGRNRILVLSTEELRATPQEVLDRCAGFLGLPPFPKLPEVRLNTTAGQGPERARVTAEDREWLREMFSADVAALRELVGLRFHEWADDFPLAPLAGARH
jgi:hypothetical protein